MGISIGSALRKLLSTSPASAQPQVSEPDTPNPNPPQPNGPRRRRLSKPRRSRPKNNNPAPHSPTTHVPPSASLLERRPSQATTSTVTAPASVPYSAPAAYFDPYSQERVVIATYRHNLEHLSATLNSLWVRFDAEPDDARLILDLRRHRVAVHNALDAYFAAQGARSTADIRPVITAIETTDLRLSNIEQQVLAEVDRLEQAASLLALRANANPNAVPQPHDRATLAADADDALIELELYRHGWSVVMDERTRARLDEATDVLRKLLETKPHTPSTPPNPSTYSQPHNSQQSVRRAPPTPPPPNGSPATLNTRGTNAVHRAPPPPRRAHPPLPPLDEVNGLPAPVIGMDRLSDPVAPPLAPKPSSGSRTPSLHQFDEAGMSSESGDEAPMRMVISRTRTLRDMAQTAMTNPDDVAFELDSRRSSQQRAQHLNNAAANNRYPSPTRNNNHNHNQNQIRDNFATLRDTTRHPPPPPSLSPSSKTAQHSLYPSPNYGPAKAAVLSPTRTGAQSSPRSQLATSTVSKVSPPTSDLLEFTPSLSADTSDGAIQTQNPTVMKNMSFASTLYNTKNARVDAISDAGLLLRRSVVRGDGRCLFRALVRCRCVAKGYDVPIERVEREDADTLRLRAVAELKKHRELLARFFVIEGDFAQYTRKMAHPRTYGGEPELLVLAKVLHVPIAVYVIKGERFKQIQVYGKQYRGEPLRILYSDGIHYDALLVCD